MTVAVIVFAVFLLAYANGANDNFKGVATLFGSGTTNYRGALVWAAVATFLGSLTSVFFAETLRKSFSGKGLVDDGLVADPQYAAAVALGAGLTVLLATRIGMPISTTHGLIGALVGAGWAAQSPLKAEQLGSSIVVPLLISPILAMIVASLGFPLLRMGRRVCGLTDKGCLCVGQVETGRIMPVGAEAAALQAAERLSVRTGEIAECRDENAGSIAVLEAGTVLDKLHFLSAGLVSYSRGLQDTPKIAAMLIVVDQFSRVSCNALVGAAIGMGGILSVRRVAETVSQKITKMDHEQGFTANVITGLIAISAGTMGLPVSTTHVSCGSLIGIGLVTGQGRWGMISKIIAAWVLTLPLGAALGATAFAVISRIQLAGS